MLKSIPNIGSNWVAGVSRLVDFEAWQREQAVLVLYLHGGHLHSSSFAFLDDAPRQSIRHLPMHWVTPLAMSPEVQPSIYPQDYVLSRKRCGLVSCEYERVLDGQVLTGRLVPGSVSLWHVPRMEHAGA